MDKNKINRVSWNNCLVWSIWHWYKYGGYLVIRRAGKRRQLWWPHFMWSPSESSPVYHFTPVGALRFPWPIFRGFVMENDFPYNKDGGKKE